MTALDLVTHVATEENPSVTKALIIVGIVIAAVIWSAKR